MWQIPAKTYRVIQYPCSKTSAKHKVIQYPCPKTSANWVFHIRIIERERERERERFVGGGLVGGFYLSLLIYLFMNEKR